MRLLRLPEVKARTGLSRSSIYLFISRREFPPAVRLSARAVAWPDDAIDRWIGSRVAASRQERAA